MIISKPLSACSQTLAAVLAIAAVAANAWAGEFYEKDGAAVKGYDPVAYFTEKKPVKGSAEHRAEYKGSVFHFSSKANRDAFAANPAKYAPQYNGFLRFRHSRRVQGSGGSCGVHGRQRQALSEL